MSWKRTIFTKFGLAVRLGLSLALSLGMTLNAGAAGVQGTVVFAGDPPRLPTLDMAADPACRAKHEGPVPSRILVLGEDREGGKALANVFVQVKNPPQRDYPVPSEPVVIDQQGCLYQPRVAGVRAGQPVLFKNSDQLMHNVRGQPEVNKPFNIGMPAVITEQAETFNKPEPLFPVKCDIHPWMQAYIAVMTHPYFAVTNEGGTFSIAGLPPGTYEVEAWHERLGTRTQTVTVEERGKATANFSFKKPD